MIRVEVIKQFTLKDFYKLNNIKRKSIDVKGTLFIGDTFDCDKELCDYLMGKNEQGKVVVKVIEFEPEKKYSFVIAEKLDDENITPLSTKEELDKLGDKIKEYVVTQPKTTKKEKSSKK